MSVKKTATMRTACTPKSNDIEIGFKEKKLVQNNIKYINNSVVSSLDESQSSSLGGGRLQFFKDGKFILELARSKAGEKTGWVSVPKKVLNSTTNITIHSKNEVCASISDDTSSIQSSPWQRDHIWRKSVPRKDISQEMCMIFKRSKETVIDVKMMRAKRRRPYDNRVTCNILSVSNQKEFTKNTKDNHLILKVVRQSIRNKNKLSAIIQRLIDKSLTSTELCKSMVITSNNINNFNTSGLRLIDGKYQSNISPRKRILRELGKITLDDSTKRSRSKNDKIVVHNTLQSNSLKNYNPLDNTARKKYLMHKPQNPDCNNDLTDKYCNLSSSTKLCSSYSIHSLLGNTCNSSDNNEINGRSPDAACNKMRRSDDNYILNTKTLKLPLKSSLQNEVEKTNETLDIKCNYNSILCRFDGNPEFKMFSSVNMDNIEQTSSFLTDGININTKQELKKKKLYNKEKESNSICTFLEHNSKTKNADLSNTSKTFPHSEIPQYDSSSDVLMSLNEKLCTTISAKNSFLTAYPLLASSFSNSTYITNFKNSDISSEPSIVIEKAAPTVHNSDMSNKSVTTNAFLGTCNSISMSSLNYMYPENIPLSICHNGSPRFIPSGSYFHPYAIAALRNPLWTHQHSISLPAPIACLPSVFSFNRINTPVNSIDISAEMKIDRKKKSEISIEEECNSDIPLNLSKH